MALEQSSISNVSVIIPAAGKSSRCKTETTKQYFIIMNKPLFMYSLEAFLSLEFISKICIVTDGKDYVEQQLELHNILNNDKILIASGGLSRHISIKNGIAALKEAGAGSDVVIVHDGARPIVPGWFVSELVKAAAAHGAAGSIRPLTSTVVRPHSDGRLEEALDRSKYVASETPQAFSFQILDHAYQRCSIEEMEYGTECLQLVLKHCGVRAFLIPGPETLWKVTHKKDCYAAAALIKEISTRVCLLACDPASKENLNKMANCLESKVAEVKIINDGNEMPGKNDNVFIFLHKRANDVHGQLLLHMNIINVNVTGLVVHILIDIVRRETNKATDLQMIGHSLVELYKKINKGVLLINVTSQDGLEDDRLMRLLSAVVLSDPDTFSGQTFYF